MHPQASCARSGVVKQAHEVSQRSHRNDPAFPAQWSTAYPDRAPRRSAHLPPPPEELPPPARHPRQGVRTTRFNRPRQAHRKKAPFTSTATRPASVTSAKRPSEWDGLARDIAVIWVFGKSEYFCGRGWTGGKSGGRGDLPVGQAVGCRPLFSAEMNSQKIIFLRIGCVLSKVLSKSFRSSRVK
jgi:hypothetical protein